MIELLPTCVTPELEYLQVKWAAHLSLATAVALLTEVLPIAGAISITGVKRRVRVVGTALETSEVARAAIPTSPAEGPQTGRPLSALAVDSVWLKHCDPPP